MKYLLLLLFLCLYNFTNIKAKVIDVGSNYAIKSIVQAANTAEPGDSIICHDVSIPGGMFISNVNGTAQQWIYILADKNKVITIQGGNNSIQFSDCSYLHFEGFVIQGQTGNGLNIDDGGSLESPTHDVKIVGCTFQNIAASGNNDLLKLSGLDDFEIINCTFLNGAAGGSGIDMVGCHHGKIQQCNFTNLGSNSIQAKGGTSNLYITRNKFENGGARALNIGGSTGLEFFRPQNAVTEAQDVKVVSNIIIGSEAAVAFVGSRNVKVSNNTIYHPGKWVIRILQETVDPSRFLPCGDNSFFNNVVITNNNVNTEVNIGPNTEPETFDFINNLWFKSTNLNWQGPNLPGVVVNQMIEDPKIDNFFRLADNSPAIGQGLPYDVETFDYFGNVYNHHTSLGAHEADPFTVSIINFQNNKNLVYPNPFIDVIIIELEKESIINIFNASGALIQTTMMEAGIQKLDASSFAHGLYHIEIVNSQREKYKLIKTN